MSKKRAFVRYSKQGKIVPGSLILTGGSYPQGPATWNEVPVDLCCNSGIKVVFQGTSYPVNTPYVGVSCGMGPTLAAGAVIGEYADVYELVAGLNAQLGYMGVFSVDGDGNVVLALSIAIADTLTNNPECSAVNGFIDDYPFGG
jgi:hypothetical protein